MRTKSNKKPNYFRLVSPRRRKIFMVLLSVILAIAFVLLVLDIVALIDLHIAEPGMAITSLFPGFIPFFRLMLRVLLVIFMAFSAVVIYNYMMNKEEHKENTETAKAETPLLGAAKDNEQPIIDLLKSVAQPLPGKTTFNTARVGQFMRALAELGYIDANLDGKYWKPWVEDVTGFAGDTTGHVNAAYKKATIHDEKVADLCQQLKQIVGK